MGYYPLFLEMKGRPCLVIGGGQVAQRKVEGLLAADAAVTVVSPELTAALEALRSEGRIEHRQRDYQSDDLKGFDIVVAATDDKAVNARVAADSRAGRVLVNAVDDPDSCDFILPSVVRRGEVVLAISTGGLSPALARRLREELEAYLSDDFAPLVELLAEVRGDLRARGVSIEATVWQRAIDDRLRELLSAGRRAEARSRLLAALGIDKQLPT